jgi:glutathionyl-hydroquinone reductase
LCKKSEYQNYWRKPMALGMLVDGKWVKDWTERDENGRFNRMPTHFHNKVTADNSSGFQAEPGRYHLYVSLGCPWAHRTVIMRKLKGLEDVISLSVVDPVISEEGWAFSDAPGCIPDTVNGTHYLREIYTLADSHYSGRVTVPVLWDKQTGTIVNNESRQIIRMLDTEFAACSTTGADLYPKDLQQRIDQTIDEIYQPINNGVYRSGFAQFPDGLRGSGDGAICRFRSVGERLGKSEIFVWRSPHRSRHLHVHHAVSV